MTYTLGVCVGGLGAWAYAAVGGMAFLETGAFVGLVVPGETVVVVGGVAASHGDVSLPLIWLAAWSGAWVGDATSFHLGRRYGPTVIAPIARRLRISEQRLSSLERSLARHGGRSAPPPPCAYCRSDPLYLTACDGPNVEIAALERGKRTATVVASSPMWLAVMTAYGMRRLASSIPQFGETLRAAASERHPLATTG